MKKAFIVAAVATAAVVSGCATVATPTTGATAQGVDQIKRIGSNIPIRERVVGPELVRMTDAQRDRQATNQMVSPMMPLKAE